MITYKPISDGDNIRLDISYSGGTIQVFISKTSLSDQTQIEVFDSLVQERVNSIPAPKQLSSSITNALGIDRQVDEIKVSAEELDNIV